MKSVKQLSAISRVAFTTRNRALHSHLPCAAVHVEVLQAELDGVPGVGGQEPLADFLLGAGGLEHSAGSGDVTSTGALAGPSTAVQTVDLLDVPGRETLTAHRADGRVLGSDHLHIGVDGKAKQQAVK